MSKSKQPTQSVTSTTESPTSKYDGLTTKSAKIRAMHADGMSRSQIAKALDVRYQHVRNVLTQNLKRV
jgi:DNA-binding NarL/FixJ family response regulator